MMIDQFQIKYSYHKKKTLVEYFALMFNNHLCSKISSNTKQIETQSTLTILSLEFNRALFNRFYFNYLFNIKRFTTRDENSVQSLIVR